MRCWLSCGSIVALLAPLTVGAAQPPAAAVLAELPFLDVDEPNRILVDLAPQGSSRPFRLMLDTGATHSVVTPGAARELGVQVRRLKRDPYRKKTLLGRDLLFFVDVGSSDTASKTGWEYGLLGGNFLKDYVVELDFEGRRVRLLDPDAYEVPEQVEGPDAAVVPLEVVSNRPTVELEINGHRSNFLLDTGAPSGTSISGKLAERIGIESQPIEGHRLFTVRGEVAVEFGRAERIGFGPFEFTPAPVGVHPNGFFNQGVSDSGLVGYDVLSQFLVRIDYPRERLYLKRRPDWRVTWHGRGWRDWSSYLEEDVEEAPDRDAPDAPDLEPERPAEPALEEQVWLELSVPAEGEARAGRVGWLEVRGWAGSGTPVQHDVAVVVDVSGSTMLASGIDVDADGKVGRKRKRIDHWRSFNPRHYSSDAGDTVLAAELLATRRLVELLGPDRSRIGLISFSSGAQLHASIGAGSAQMDEALSVLEENFGSGATDMSAAIDLAVDALVEAGGESRQKTVLILSDGYPTAPGSEQRAAAEALQRAQRARDVGVRIYTFGLGLEEVREDDVYASMAEVTGGEYRRLDVPGEVIHELPRIDLARVAGVEIENLSAGEAGQAIRVFPDGSFDGFVRLIAGDNRIRVTATGDGGGRRSVERTVVFEQREPRDAAEARAFDDELERLRARLAVRATESELAAEAARRQRARQRRELEVRPETAAQP